MKKYDFRVIEKKWQAKWDESGVFEAEQPTADKVPEKPKYYCLIEFPYPSGEGLHVGHPRSYTALDTIARKKRLEGFNVLYPMGWDAFGLPTENFAIAHNIHPAKVTEDNIKHFKKQLKSLGFSFNWSREVNTTDPEYYRWTQWIFLQLNKHGLAYKKKMNVNWCPSCRVVLANEEVVDGACERCHTPATHKVKSQWMLKITKYADKLLEGLDDLDFIERVKLQQRNWIGRSYGMDIKFKTTSGDILITYTTRPDTLWGATYMVLSPELGILEEWIERGLLTNVEEIRNYQNDAAKKSEFERSELNKDKTGVCLEGVRGINPATQQEIPIYISDYVLATYGTGAIMAVPAHDSRDYEFAKAFDLPIVEVVAGGDISAEAYTDIEEGVLVNSGFITGLSVSEGSEKVMDRLEKDGLGVRTTNYKLRDWVFSRQRYWGEPIPMVNCEKCGWQPLPESELPLILPEIETYELTETGESPLALLDDWVNTSCPNCGGPAKRETDTMPQWAGSSWYFIRYTDPHCNTAIASDEAMSYWLPVDWYNGGMEHTTLHLLYSRFWYLFLHDIGAVPTPEPYLKRTSHGMILGENGEKMSKSRGNVVNPDDIVREYGADTLRMYELFIGDFEKPAPWSTSSIKGVSRFIERVWALQEKVIPGSQYRPETRTLMHQTIRKVTKDTDSLKANTAIAQLMTLVNRLYELGSVNDGEYRTLLILLNIFAPHVTEELWEIMNYEGEITDQNWPVWEDELTIEDTVEIAVQINGKIRARLDLPNDISQEDAIAAAKAQKSIAGEIAGKKIIKEIFVPGRLINFVVSK